MTETLSPGAAINRFEIVRLLGQGGMGAVYEARDAKLDRSIAIKLIREPDVHRALRLLREAQLLAQLQHPNVVTVHELGMHGDQVFVAMELVDGQSLDRLAPGPVGWRAVTALFVQVGRGLAAAHAKGIVHRDVKPSNILVDRGGRARIGDFGLARLGPGEGTSDGSSEPAAVAAAPISTIDPSERTTTGDGGAPLAAPVHGAAELALTHPGAYLGTPRYMAPEQHARQPATARSDQFSFCLAMWEALFGEHPFDHDSGGIGDAVLAGRRRPAPGSAPRWLVRALERGLEREPGARHPSVSALVDVLERTPSRRRRARFGLGAAALAVVAFAGAWVYSRDVRPSACDAAGDGYAAVWNAGVRRTITATFTKARNHGADTAVRAAAALDRYGERWRAARRDACRAGGELLDRRMGCLDQALLETRSAVELFTAGDARTVDGAVEMVSRLPDPAACDASRVSGALPIPDDPRAKALTADLAKLRALNYKADFREAQRLSTSVRAAADALGHPGLRAHALYEYANAFQLVDPAASNAALEEALAEAVRARLRRLEITVTNRMLANAVITGSPKDIEAILPVARAAVARGGLRATDWKDFYTGEAMALGALHRTEEALAACERLRPYEDVSSMDVAGCRCSAYWQAQRTREAEQACRQSLDWSIKKYGSNHPLVAESLTSLAQAVQALGRADEALELDQRGLAIATATFGADSPNLIRYLRPVRSDLLALRRPAEAKAIAEKVLGMLEKRGQKGHELAEAHGDLGQTLLVMDEHEAALTHLEAALRAYIEFYGADSRHLDKPYLDLGQALAGSGRHEDALAAYARAADITGKAYGVRHHRRGNCLALQAQALVSMRRWKQARQVAEEARSILDASPDAQPIVKGTAHHMLGNALARTGDRARARVALREALAIYRSLGEAAREPLAAAEAALRKLR